MRDWPSTIFGSVSISLSIDGPSTIGKLLLDFSTSIRSLLVPFFMVWILTFDNFLDSTGSIIVSLLRSYSTFCALFSFFSFLICVSKLWLWFLRGEFSSSFCDNFSNFFWRYGICCCDTQSFFYICIFHILTYLLLLWGIFFPLLFLSFSLIVF